MGPAPQSEQRNPPHLHPPRIKMYKILPVKYRIWPLLSGILGGIPVAIFPLHSPKQGRPKRFVRRVDLRTGFFAFANRFLRGGGRNDGEGRPTTARHRSKGGETRTTHGPEGESATARREISGVEVRTNTRKPFAYVEPLDQLPKSGHQDSNNASIRAPAYEGCQAVIVTQVYPASSSQKGISAILEEEDKGQKFQTVDQCSVAKEIHPNSGGTGRTRRG